MAPHRRRLTRKPEEAAQQRAKKPALLRPARADAVHADPHALQSGQEIGPAGVQSLQRAIGNRAVSEMIVQRAMPPEEEKETGAAPTTLPPAGPGPIPTPYPNQMDVGSTKKITPKIKMESKKAAITSSQVPSSRGDEAGTMKGLVSQTTPPFKTKTPEEKEER